MLSAHVAAGFDPEAFWDLTPRLYLLHMQARARQADQAARDATSAAWLTAALVRAAKLPKLSRLLKAPPGAPTASSVGVRLAALKTTLPTMSMSEWRSRIER